MFKGSMTAIVTPFDKGEIDWDTFEKLIEWHIDQGTHGLVVCGTTGESPTLTSEEHIEILKRSVDLVKGRIPVIGGTGSNSTAKTVDTTRVALKTGIDAALIVTPYYNKPTQEGLYQHYKTIAESVNIPVILYNVPGRCGVDLKTETVARLAKFSNIIALKDATGDIDRPAKLASLVNDDFIQLSGDDPTTIEFLEAGGHGSISVTANIAPSQCAKLHNAWTDGNKDEARSINEHIMPLHKALFCETSPSPVKYAMEQMGLCRREVRLPIVEASENCRKIVDKALATTGLISKENASMMRHG